LGLDSVQQDDLKAVQRKWEADGMEVIPRDRRSYPLRDTASGVIGRISGSGKQIQASGGVEEGLGAYLSGGDLPDDFELTGLTDDVREQILISEERSLSLTIDTELQRRALFAVKKAVESNGALMGSAIVYEVETGALKAMANWPTFDPHAIKPNDDFFNISHQGRLEPGSMIKLMTLAIGLDSGAVTMDERHQIDGPLRRPESFRTQIRNHKAKYFGDTDVTTAIARSCNVSASLWAESIGSELLAGFYEAAGVLNRPKIGAAQEANGWIPDSVHTNLRDLMVLGWGQTITMTPVQTAALFGTLCTEGVMMKPRLIESIGGQRLQPQIQADLLTPETCKTVLAVSEQVFDHPNGTGRSLKIPQVRLGGKTGSVEKPANGDYVANFVGFAPLDDPKYVILVMVDKPTGEKVYGAEVAGPAFHEIVRGMLGMGMIQPTLQEKAPPES
jgi:cell division protein FtsI/penicillin-binding protein 2